MTFYKLFIWKSQLFFKNKWVWQKQKNILDWRVAFRSRCKSCLWSLKNERETCLKIKILSSLLAFKSEIHQIYEWVSMISFLLAFEWRDTVLDISQSYVYIYSYIYIRLTIATTAWNDLLYFLHLIGLPIQGGLPAGADQYSDHVTFGNSGAGNDSRFGSWSTE